MPFVVASYSSRTVFDYSNKNQEIAGIEEEMTGPNFWDKQEAAQARVATLKSLKAIVGPMLEAEKGLTDLDSIFELAEEDSSFAAEVPDTLMRLEQLVQDLELRGLLDGEHDARGALVSINARDGGTDANDWAEMLLRMYLQWAQKNDYTTELLDRQDNEQAGIASATIAIRGPMAYGYLKGEGGIHRLIRISPFNSEGKRQTSFAAIDVSPELPESAEIEIDREDVREDTFCASGAGGQHVNKTASAIRLTHIPSGIVVQCQAERSQHKNRATAYKMLRSRMARAEEVKREAEQAEKYKNQAKVGFGSQIRSYFQHPEQRVTDARTGHKVNHFQTVLDGNIQDFLDSYLRWRVGQEQPNS